MNHDEITAIVSAQGGYGKGITPNLYAEQQQEWVRRNSYAKLRDLITAKIVSLFEPRFITPPETSEFIEALITMTDSRKILELGTCTGFTSLHMLRAVVGKDNAKVISIDARPAHDREWFTSPAIAPWFEFVEGWTPEILTTLKETFDLVFVDSDHSVEHTQKELGALWAITRPGTIFCFHDLPRWQSPSNHTSVPVRTYLESKVADGTFAGLILPTCEQLDCLSTWGPGYPSACNPHLGVFIRQ